MSKGQKSNDGKVVAAPRRECHIDLLSMSHSVNRDIYPVVNLDLSDRPRSRTRVVDLVVDEQIRLFPASTRHDSGSDELQAVEEAKAELEFLG